MTELLEQLGDNDKELLKHSIKIAEEAGKILFKNFRKEKPLQRGTAKGVKLLYDMVADKIIKDALESRFPLHSYVTEETGFVDKGSEYLWIIDPLDGTSNFADQNPMFAVSIALWKGGEPLLGVIEAPILKERFVAFRDHGSFHNDLLRKKTREASVSNITESTEAYGVYCEGGSENKKHTLELLEKYYMQLKDTRKLGSAALELAFVGTGRSDCYMTTEISLWDIAAGLLFVTEAGGGILDHNGTPYEWREFKHNQTYDLLATNGKLDINLR